MGLKQSLCDIPRLLVQFQSEGNPFLSQKEGGVLERRVPHLPTAVKKGDHDYHWQ